MEKFPGFPNADEGTPFPDSFFTKILPEIEDATELKIILYAFWITHNNELEFPVFSYEYFEDIFYSDSEGSGRFSHALSKVVKQGIIFEAVTTIEDKTIEVLILNTPRGQAALQAINDGTFRMGQSNLGPWIMEPRPSNIFKLYEENIGVLTPILADSLRDMENEYPAEWITEAFTIAIKRNARNFRYIETVLENWRKEGKDDRTNRGSRKTAQEKSGTEGYTDDQFPGLFKKD